MTRHLFLVFFLVLGTISTQSYGKVIVWDMNGVLTRVSHSGVIKEVGLLNLLGYSLTKFKSPLPVIFKGLEEIWGQQECTEDNLFACHGPTPLPQAMCHWQTGKLTGQEIIDNFSEHVSNSTLQSMVRAMFTPEVLAKHTHLIEEGSQLLETYDTSDNTMVILSNFDPRGFSLLLKKEELEVIFKHFEPENIIVSGNYQTMKPHREIYEILKKRLVEIDERFSDPDFLKTNSLFLDDQKENVAGALKSGITAVQVPNKDYNKAKIILHEMAFAKKSS